MKKILFAAPLILLLAAACNKASTVSSTVPSANSNPTPTTQSTNSTSEQQQSPSPVSNTSSQTTQPYTNQNTKIPVNVVNKTSPTPSAIPLNQAIKNYSDNNSYNFSDGSGSNVDVVGTIKSLVPIQSGITEAFGNTIIITDGIYIANIHNISDADFQNLSVGEKVEIKGGYMQSPSNNNAPIIHVDSVKIYQ